MLTERSIKKTVVVGPESTGKSTLCQQLAAHYQSSWCPEYAREYLLKNGTNYTFEHLLDTAKGQIALEEKATKELIEQLLQQRNENAGSKPFLFIDTDMYVMKVWCEFVFGQCHKFILDQNFRFYLNSSYKYCIIIIHNYNNRKYDSCRA